MSRQKPQWTQSSINRPAAAGERRTRSSHLPATANALDPAHEHAGVAGPGGVEAHLDPAHQLERRHPRAAPHGSSRSRAGRRERRAAPRRAPAGSALRAARGTASGSTSTQLEPSAARPTSVPPAAAAARSTSASSSLGRAATGPARSLWERWPARWRSQAARRRRRLSTALEPGFAHQHGHPLRARRRASGPPSGRARRRGPRARRRRAPRARAAPIASARAAAAEHGRIAVRAERRGGVGRSGCRRTLTARITPSVPNEPANSLARS